MNSEQWQQVKEVFEAALELGPRERTAFLAQACKGDEELMREVQSLLAAHDADSGFMNEPVGNLLVGAKPILTAGQHFGHYEEISLLGEGGMGQVYLAVDNRLRRKVALKLLPSSFTHDADRVRRFEQEAQAASALNHPNIVTIYEIGQVESIHFIATEFVDGKTLREHIADTELPVGEVLDLTAQIASALHAAHEAGIIHRDIKPENIMLRRDGVVKVLDFGLAKLTPQQGKAVDGLAHSKVQTNPGVVMGTVAYMSPEQARGQEVDARTDIWSFGVVLYEMVAGCLPFDGETASHLIVSILECDPSPLSLRMEVPDELERIISKALSKNKEKRYQIANDLSVELKRLKEELTLESRQQQFSRLASSGRHTSTSDAGGQTSADSAFSIARFTTSAEYLVNQIMRHKGSAVFASTTALLLILILSFFPNLNKERVEAIDSVAVLSFVNESGDGNVEYLVDGISDSVITGLSRLGKLRVVSLSTVLRYKGKQIDPQQVGRELNVSAVLVGRVMHLGDSLVISSELVDVRNNSRLWGARYNAKTTEILIVQEQIANEVVEALRLKSSDPEKPRLTKLGTTSSEAYEAYLRGKYLLEKRTGPAVEKSVEYFQQAIKLDTNYALAYAALAYAYWSLDGLRAEEFFVKSKEAVTKALEIDSTLAEAHTTLGHIRSTDWDWKGAEESFKRGIELNPNSGFAHSNYALFLIAEKRLEEAVAESKRAVELEPTSVLFNRNLGAMLYFARRYDEAIAQCQKTLELDPIMPTAHRWLAKSYAQKGLFRQAIDAYCSTYDQESASALKDAYAASGWQGFWRKSIDLTNGIVGQEKYVDPYSFAEAYMQVGERDQVFAWLEKAFQQRRRTLKFVVADPLWDNLRSDPRYIDLVRRMRLEP